MTGKPTRIRPGVPNALRDLNDAIGKASNTVFDLRIDSPPEAFDRAADEIHAAFTIARDLARPPSATGCPHHPHGPIDPHPIGGSTCLFCNTNQRRSTRPAQPHLTRHTRRTP